MADISCAAITLQNTPPSAALINVTLVEYRATLLHIARLADPANSMGAKGKSNLTIQNLPNLIDHPPTKKTVTALVADSLKATEFCRDWRNRLIAHRDLDLALDQSARPLCSAM
jgi:hypothetical protein